MGKNRLIVFLFGLLLVVSGVVQLAFGGQSPNPAYFHWLEQKNQTMASTGSSVSLSAPPPRVIRQRVTIETGLAAIGLVSGAGLLVFAGWKTNPVCK